VGIQTHIHPAILSERPRLTAQGLAQGGICPPAGRGSASGKPSSVPAGATRDAGLPPSGDGHPSTATVTRHLQRPTRVTTDEQSVGVYTRTLPGLAPSGVCLADRLPGRRWALTPPFHLRRHGAGCVISVALSLRFPSPGVTRRSALRSSDFPRPVFPAATICPPPDPMVGQAGGSWRVR